MTVPKNATLTLTQIAMENKPGEGNPALPITYSVVEVTPN